MKKLLSRLMLLGTLAACQPVAPIATTSGPGPGPAAGSRATRQPAAGPGPAHIRLPASDSLSPAMRAFARRHNLSAVWLGQEEDRPVPTVLNGFFGPDHYRIELVLLDVSRDAADPLLYHVYGKDRYKKQVTAFRGAIRLQRLRPVAIQGFIEELQGEFARFYTARGEFQFREFEAAGAGTFSGVIGIDFQQKADSSLAVRYFWGDEHKQYANGDERYLKGQWVAPHLARPKELLAGVTPEAIAPALFPDFNVGERGFKLNPKYAKLGWEDYWKNEEWWAESPTSNLSL